MIVYVKRFWVLAAMLEALTCFVVAVGFISLGGIFESFTSSNSTPMAVGLVRDISAAFVARSLVLSLVFGVLAGSCVASRPPDIIRP
jgi:uncharacterized membrane protein YoaK (UPF0700 family)